LIRQVNIINDLGERLIMELDSPEKSGLIVLNIEGIGPEKANLNIDDSSNVDGGIFNSAKIPTRNIRFSLRFWDLPSIEQNRRKTYRYFPLTKKIKMEFITDFRQAYIYGVVESNTPNIFSKEEGCSISVLCEDPNFYKIKGNEEYNIENFSDTIGAFYFPFIQNPINEDLESNRDGFIFGERFESNAYSLVNNDGDDDCYPIIRLHNFSAGTHNINIKNLITNEELVIENIVTSDEYDELIINSTKGSKEIYLYNSLTEVKTNKINSKTISSDWLSLIRGDNLFYCSSLETDSFKAEVRFKTIYKGI